MNDKIPPEGLPAGDSRRFRTFFQFNIGHAFILLGMASSVFWWFVTYDREFQSMKFAVQELVKGDDKMSARIDKIDENGTQFSRGGISQESSFIKANADRILELEKTSKALAPKLDRMDYTLQTINDWVNEQKHKPPTR